MAKPIKYRSSTGYKILAARLASKVVENTKDKNLMLELSVNDSLTKDQKELIVEKLDCHFPAGSQRKQILNTVSKSLKRARTKELTISNKAYKKIEELKRVEGAEDVSSMIIKLCDKRMRKLKKNLKNN